MAAFLVRDCATVASRIDDLHATDQTAHTAPIRWISAAPYAAVPEAQPSRMPDCHRDVDPRRFSSRPRCGGFCAISMPRMTSPEPGPAMPRLRVRPMIWRRCAVSAEHRLARRLCPRSHRTCGICDARRNRPGPLFPTLSRKPSPPKNVQGPCYCPGCGQHLGGDGTGCSVASGDLEADIGVSAGAPSHSPCSTAPVTPAPFPIRLATNRRRLLTERADEVIWSAMASGLRSAGRTARPRPALTQRRGWLRRIGVVPPCAGRGRISCRDQSLDTARLGDDLGAGAGRIVHGGRMRFRAAWRLGDRNDRPFTGRLHPPDLAVKHPEL